jgi:hypothetical protein
MARKSKLTPKRSRSAKGSRRVTPEESPEEPLQFSPGGSETPALESEALYGSEAEGEGEVLSGSEGEPRGHERKSAFDRIYTMRYKVLSVFVVTLVGALAVATGRVRPQDSVYLKGMATAAMERASAMAKDSANFSITAITAYCYSSMQDFASKALELAGLGGAPTGAQGGGGVETIQEEIKEAAAESQGGGGGGASTGAQGGRKAFGPDVPPEGLEAHRSPDEEKMRADVLIKEKARQNKIRRAKAAAKAAANAKKKDAWEAAAAVKAAANAKKKDALEQSKEYPRYHEYVNKKNTTSKEMAIIPDPETSENQKKTPV